MARATVARRSRSAVICRFIAATRLAGGSILRSSTRLTFTPQGAVAWSSVASSVALISSRPDSAPSRSMAPITLRMLVIAMLVRAWTRFCAP